MEYIYQSLGLLIFILAAVIAFLNRNDSGKFISCLLLGVFFSTFFMVLPTQWIKAGNAVFYEPVYNVLSALLYSFKALGGRQDIAQLETAPLTGALKGIYIAVNYISFVLAPVLSSGLILSFFGDTGEKMRLALHFSPKCYVFSTLNGNSLALAEAIKKQAGRKTIVFCATKSTDKALIAKARKLGAITLYKPCESFKTSWRFKKYEFCLLSDNEDDNIKSAKVLIDKYRNAENQLITINAFAESGTNITALESFMKKTPCCVFSELNKALFDEATRILTDNPKTKIVFCSTQEADDALLSAAFEKEFILYKSGWEGVRLCPELKNCEFTLYAPDGGDIKRTDLKVYKNRFTTQWVEDTLRLRFIDEIALFCNNLLFEYPLYDLPDGRKDISVMIVGCGRLGMRMLKTAIWCGQIDGYTLKIRVYDKAGKKAEREFYRQCPDINLPEYDIKFIEADAESSDFEEKMAESLDATFVSVATGNDELNITTADYLYGIFRKHNSFGYTPPIFARVRGNTKSANFSEKSAFLSNRKIHLFGTAESIFADSTLFNTKLENLAFAVHLCYWGGLDADKDSFYFKRVLSDFKSSEYDRRSSMATALHIASKLRSCGLLEPTEHELTDSLADSFKETASRDTDLIDRLSRHEHIRWNAFMRSEGYRCADIETVKKYAYTNRSHKDDASKLHPCLIDWESLDELAREYDKLGISMGKTDFKKYDIKIVKEIPKIIKLANELSREE